MNRLHCIAFLSLCVAAAACTQKGPSGSPDQLIETASPEAKLPDITPEGIAHDVIGHTVRVSSLDGQTEPVDWTFDADETRTVRILGREASTGAATITIFMMTASNPDAEEPPLELSGKLKLRYEREGNRWALKTIENLSFRYTAQAGVTV